MRLAFVACVEPGRLEDQGVLLFESIRRHGGRLANAPIVSFQPRDPGPLRPETLAAFARLDVEHRCERLNREFEHIPVANKLFATARAESELEADVVVFLDSDTFFCSEPAELALADGRDVALRPANKKNVASTGPDDRKDGYWQKVYALCGVDSPPYVETTVDRQRVRAYWNAGLMAFRRSAGLADRWLACFRAILRADLLPYNGVKNADQIALAAALASAPDRVEVLDPRYNYPLPKRADLPEPWRHAELETLRHVHYFRWLNKPGWFERIDPPFAEASEVRRWLAARLPLTPTVEDARRKTGGVTARAR
jgi:hypothetical protein